MGEEHCARADPAAPAAGHPAAGWGSTGHPAAGWGSGPPLPSTPSAAVLAPPSPRPPHNPLQGQASWGGPSLPQPCLQGAPHLSGDGTFLGTAPRRPPRPSPGWDMAGASRGTGVVGPMGDPTTTTARAAPRPPSGKLPPRPPQGRSLLPPSGLRGQCRRSVPAAARPGLVQSRRSAGAESAARGDGWPGLAPSDGRLGPRRQQGLPGLGLCSLPLLVVNVTLCELRLKKSLRDS